MFLKLLTLYIFDNVPMVSVSLCIILANKRVIE